MKNFILYYNNNREAAYCTKYPLKKEIHTLDDLKEVVSHDHVGAEYRDYHRKNENFIQANCTMFDVDNTETDDPKNWKTPADIQKAFPRVPFYVSYSRNHMKPKGDKAPRPKFHIYFPDVVISDSEAYKQLKERVCAYFPMFDDNAKDTARFFYGVENPQVEFYQGDLPLSDFIKMVQVDKKTEPKVDSQTTKESIIPEGKRNTTMHRYALKVLTRFGSESGEAEQAFKKEAEKCSPMLEEKELADIWDSALKFYQTDIQKSPDYIPPEKFNKQKSLKPKDFTDLGQANVFALEYRDRVRYSTATDYIFYNGMVWDEDRVKVHGLAQELTERQLIEAITMSRQAHSDAIEDDDPTQDNFNNKIEAAKKYCSFVKKHRNTQRIKAIMDEAEPKLQIEVDKLDSDPFKLNTPAGYVDLVTGEIKPHRPTDYCTKITKVKPGNEGAGLFNDFLKKITCGDKELEDYLQLIAGMCAVGKVFNENLIIACGSGKNGKSTFFNLLAKVLGSYAGALSAETLTSQSRKNKHPEYAELRGKRIVIASELEGGTYLDSATVKKLCSTDPIYAEKKYKDPFLFTPSHTLILHTNKLPRVRTSDFGTWRRLVVVPFLAVIEDGIEIKNYCDYLSDRAGGAVLSWIIEGAGKYISKQYKVEYPQAVKEAIRKYQEDNNVVHNFISDRCETGTSYVQPAGELYKEYRAYCSSIGEYPLSSAAFKEEVEIAGYCWRRCNKGAFYYGLRLVLDYPIYHNDNTAEEEPIAERGFITFPPNPSIPKVTDSDIDLNDDSDDDVEF